MYNVTTYKNCMNFSAKQFGWVIDRNKIELIWIE